VILSGGSGTRLWPLSTRDRPKQFLDLLGHTLFEATLLRVASLEGAAPALIATGADHLDQVERGVEAAGVEVRSILVEPAGRNTAPAVIAAALVADPEDVLLVMPADHVITDQDGFAEAVATAVEVARSGAIVLFGVPPSRPETGYGYIEIGRGEGPGFQVERFEEKPSPDVAEQYLADGSHLWNSGMFVFSAQAIIAECEAFEPGIIAAVRSALPAEPGTRLELGPAFLEAPSISIDYAVIERTTKAVVVPVDIGWSDVGSWQAVWEAAPHDDEGNAIAGDVIVDDVTGSYVRAESRRVAVLGVTDVVVVETADAVLVVPMEKSQRVREIVDRIEADDQD
jgi:mannose-1-phosphate guanylyltransferase/mannose-6-phosphate isomerase